MKTLTIVKSKFSFYPWGRSKRALGIMGLFFVLTLPSWMALRQADKALASWLCRLRQQEETAVFFRRLLIRHEDMGERYGRMNMGRVSLDEGLTQLHALAAKQGIRITSMRPAPQEEKSDADGVRRRKLELVFEAQEDAVFRFLNGLSELTFFSTPETLGLTASSSAGSLMEVHMTLLILDALRIPRKKALDHLKKTALSGPVIFAHSDIRVSGKRIFGSVPARSQQTILPREKKEDIMAHLALVGILEDMGRRAVFEDKRTSRTFYVCVNDAVGDLVVTEIGDNRVTFAGGGQCYTLAL